jgi:hypothetical protein
LRRGSQWYIHKRNQMALVTDWQFQSQGNYTPPTSLKFSSGIWWDILVWCGRLAWWGNTFCCSPYHETEILWGLENKE